jgi:hypothetical protein
VSAILWAWMGVCARTLGARHALQLRGAPVLQWLVRAAGSLQLPACNRHPARQPASSSSCLARTRASYESDYSLLLKRKL